VVYTGLLRHLQGQSVQEFPLSVRETAPRTTRGRQQAAEGVKDADRAADSVARAAVNVRRTLALKAGLVGKAEAVAGHCGLFERVEVIIAPDVRARVRKRLEYKGGSRRWRISRVTGFRVHPRADAFTANGLAALAAPETPGNPWDGGSGTSTGTATTSSPASCRGSCRT
jgi:hypothetical protein